MGLAKWTRSANRLSPSGSMPSYHSDSSAITLHYIGVSLSPLFTSPYLRKLDLLGIKNRTKKIGIRDGVHRSSKLGHGQEFAEHQNYSPGDSPRSIDWGLFARTDRVMVKKYEEERALRIVIIVDASASLRNFPEVWRKVSDTALSLAAVALASHDTVVLCVGASVVSTTRKGGLSQLALTLEKVPAISDFSSVRPQILAQVKFPSIGYVITDCLYPVERLERLLRQLGASRLESSLVHIEQGTNNSMPTSDIIAVDSETGMELSLSSAPELRSDFDALISKHNQSVRDCCKRCAVKYVFSKQDQGVEELVVSTMVKASILSF